MTADPAFSHFAALVAEPARAAMLAHLLDGRSWTVAELGKAAGVGASTASTHLRKLLDGRLVNVSPSGRHRYVRLAGPDVARMLEQLAQFSASRVTRTPGERRAASNLRYCRLCYDHLAGEVGVAITQSMLRHSWLVEDEPWYRLTAAGRWVFTELGVDLGDGRTCMDWSERRLHLAGPLGRELARSLLERDWMRRAPKSRALWVTPFGAEQLTRVFGISVGNRSPGAV